MNVKKSEQADMTRRSPLYFLIGLNIVLLIVFLLIEFDRDYTVPEVEEEVVLPPINDEEVIITERQFDEPPPPIETPAPPDIPIEMKAVDNDVILEDPPKVTNLNEKLEEQNYNRGKETDTKKTPPNLGTKEEEAPKNTVDKPLDRTTAKRAMIYPGCEKYENDNRELYKCFNDKFSNDLRNNLDDFEMEDDEKKQRVTLAFEIDKNGNLKLTNLSDKGTKKEYSDNSRRAFERLADQMERKASRGKGIQPALNSENKPATMAYSIPITFQPGN